jgi:hypothetical protein
MSERNLAKWSFEGISNDDKGKLIALAGQVRRGSGKYIQAALELGEVLTVAQEILANHKGGTFGLWLESECGLSKRTAYRYLAAYNFQTQVGELCQLAQPSLEVMEVLGNVKASPDAVKEAATLMSNGRPVTRETAKELVDKYMEDRGPKPLVAEAIINPQSRKAVHTAVSHLVRALSAIGIYDEFDAALSQILERMEQL